MLQPENAIHISNYYDNKGDNELKKLEAFLIQIAQIKDVRPVRDKLLHFR